MWSNPEMTAWYLASSLSSAHYLDAWIHKVKIRTAQCWYTDLCHDKSCLLMCVTSLSAMQLQILRNNCVDRATKILIWRAICLRVLWVCGAVSWLNATSSQKGWLTWLGHVAHKYNMDCIKQLCTSTLTAMCAGRVASCPLVSHNIEYAPCALLMLEIWQYRQMDRLIDWLINLRFYVLRQHKIGHFGDVLPSQSLG